MSEVDGRTRSRFKLKMEKLFGLRDRQKLGHLVLKQSGEFVAVLNGCNPLSI